MTQSAVLRGDVVRFQESYFRGEASGVSEEVWHREIWGTSHKLGGCKGLRV